MHRPVRALIPILFTVSLISAVSLLTARRAQPVPLYAARTGLMCASCHFDPNGGGPRNEFGFNFAKQRHDLTPEDSTSQWASLALVNRVGDSFPLYFGVNQRFMALANSGAPLPGVAISSDSLQRAGFFSMETALYVTFQPHPRLTLVYSRDGFESGSITQDAFGMISGFGWDGYLKAGRFRTPFGLRMDDHTVATRNSFLDFQSPPLEPGFLPYDPRFPDEGLEYGVTKGNWFGRASLTNGRSNALGGSGGPFAAAWTGKLGYNRSAFQVAGSFYDDYYKSGLSLYGYKRTTRWGAYGLTHWKKLAFLGELDAGTDEVPSGVKVNKWAGFVETDYAPVRWTNFRLRYDALSLANLGDPVIRDQGQYQRWSLEGEFVPVPFAEIRWALRYIDPKADTDPIDPTVKVPNERQAFVQLHFSY